jgi:hypothetical protein
MPPKRLNNKKLKFNPKKLQNKLLKKKKMPGWLNQLNKLMKSHKHLLKNFKHLLKNHKHLLK